MTNFEQARHILKSSFGPRDYDYGKLERLIEKALDKRDKEIACLREPLKRILGWRERDRNDMAEVIRFIEDTASQALSK